MEFCEDDPLSTKLLDSSKVNKNKDFAAGNESIKITRWSEKVQGIAGFSVDSCVILVDS